MDDSTTKRCSKCGAEKPLDQFSKARWMKDGRYPSCKVCKNAQSKQHREAHPEEHRARHHAYDAAHPDAKIERSRVSYVRNRERVIARTSQYQRDHPDVRRKAKRVYWMRHRNRLLAEYAASPERRAKASASSRRWNATHRDRIRILGRAYRVAHADRARAYQQQWVASHRDTVRAYHRKFAKLHPVAMMIKGRHYRARKRGAPGSHTAAEWQALKARYYYRCLCCGKQEPEIGLTADHIVPLIHGGSDSIENLQPLCLSCNSRKGRWRSTDYRPALPPTQLSFDL